ncbi:kinase-like domain-containing protein [Entophlyctis helioformis]|nr:kinase-like domain-containing protein [Entophlyctis helioformis]
MADSVNRVLHPRVVPLPQPPSYRCLRRLGTGATSTVYLATPKHPLPHGPPTHVAIKAVAKQRLLSHTAAATRLVTEISLLRRLSHPHIIRYLDVEWTSDTVFIVLEHAAHGSLADLLHRTHRTHALPVTAATYILRHMVSGLAYCVQQGVRHCDIKPSNVVVCASVSGCGAPVFKICDFGVAVDGRGVGDDDDGDGDGGGDSEEGKGRTARQRDHVVGTPGYMAPEVHTGVYDARSDLWSVGVVLYEMIVGRLPDRIDGGGGGQPLERVRVPSEVVERRRVPAGVVELAEGLLVVNVEERMGFSQLFGHDVVDLAHVPGEESRECGMAYVKRALAADKCGVRGGGDVQKMREAVDAYMEGVAHLLAYVQAADPGPWVGLVPGLVPVSVQQQQQQVLTGLRTEIRSYMDRIEWLRDRMDSHKRGQPDTSLSSSSSSLWSFVTGKWT